MKRPTRKTLVLVHCLLALLATICLGQDGKSGKLKERQLHAMRKRIVSLKAVGTNGEDFQFHKYPLLRYSDTERGVLDATLWAIGDKGRPNAVVVLEIYDDDDIQFEFTAASELPKSVQSSSWSWEPKESDFTWHEVPEPTPPKSDRRDRRTQLSTLARGFKATEVYQGVHQLELMPQPIHWYEDRAKGVIDGAVFVLAHGTNAEILLFLEVQQKEGGDPTWMAGFSRLGSAKLDVTFKEIAFWSRPTFYGNARRTYFFKNEPLTEEERALFRPND